MDHRKFSILSLFKSGLMILTLNAALLWSAHAATSVPTEKELVETATTYISSPDKSSFIKDLCKFVSSKEPSEELRKTLSSIRDADGKNLAHVFLRKFVPWNELHALLRATGPDVLNQQNTAGQFPLGSRSLGYILPSLIKPRSHLEGDAEEEQFQKFHQLIKPYFKRDMEPQITKLINDLCEEEKGKSYLRPVLRQCGEIRLFLAVIQINPTLLSGVPIRIMQDFCTNSERVKDLLETKEGRDFLKDYKVGSQSLVQYNLNRTSIYVSERYPGGNEWMSEAEVESYPDLLDPMRRYRNSVWEDFLLSLKAYDDIISLSGVLNIEVSDMKRFGSRFSRLTGNFLTHYRNNRGQNLIDLAVRLNIQERDNLLKIFKDKINDDKDNKDKDVFIEMLTAQDSNGNIPVFDLIKTRASLEFLRELDDRLLTVPVGPYEITPLMFAALYKYNLAGFLNDASKDQSDEFGNTVDSIRALTESDPNAEETLVAKCFRNIPLESGFWDKVQKLPYNRNNFSSVALAAARSAPQTPLYKAFWQIDVSQERTEANKLWRCFFETQEGSQTRGNPLSLRMLSLPMPDDVKTQILSGNSTWGINFKRKAEPHEVVLMRDTIEAMVDQLSDRVKDKLEDERCSLFIQDLNKDFKLALNPNNERNLEEIKDRVIPKLKSKTPEKTDEMLWNEYKDSFCSRYDMQYGIQYAKDVSYKAMDKLATDFFQAYPGKIDKVNQDRLLNHQLNCAIIAWHYFIQKNPDFLANKDKSFKFIDDQLKSKLPEEMSVNSRGRFQRIMGLPPNDNENRP